MIDKIDTDGIELVMRSDGGEGVEVIAVGPNGQIGKPLPLPPKGYITLATSMAPFAPWAWKKR